MDLKKFVIDHKKELIIGGVIITGTVGCILAVKYGKVSVLKTQKAIYNAMDSVSKTVLQDLPKPNWEGIEVLEHWVDQDMNMMIANTYAYRLGELGDHLIQEYANADIPIGIILSYGAP